jgi:hypothetical protein
MAGGSSKTCRTVTTLLGPGELLDRVIFDERRKP